MLRWPILVYVKVYTLYTLSIKEHYKFYALLIFIYSIFYYYK